MQGISTRSVDDLIKGMGASGVSKSCQAFPFYSAGRESTILMRICGSMRPT